jgi:hypothetical protein
MANREPDLHNLSLREALILAITALNQPRNFNTTIANPDKPGKFLKSYELIPLLRKAIDQSDIGLTPTDFGVSPRRPNEKVI